jgi:hypothetical protein
MLAAQDVRCRLYMRVYGMTVQVRISMCVCPRIIFHRRGRWVIDRVIASSIGALKYMFGNFDIVVLRNVRWSG